MTVAETEIVETETVTKENRVPAVECHLCGNATPKDEAVYEAIDIGEWRVVDMPAHTTAPVEARRTLDGEVIVNTVPPSTVKDAIGWGDLRAYCPDCSAKDLGYVRDDRGEMTPLKERTPRIEYSKSRDEFFLRVNNRGMIKSLTDPEIVADLRKQTLLRPLGRARSPLAVFETTIATVQYAIKRAMGAWFSLAVLFGTLIAINAFPVMGFRDGYIVLAFWAAVLAIILAIGPGGDE